MVDNADETIHNMRWAIAILSCILIWIILFMFLALVTKKRIFSALSLVCWPGYKIYTRCWNMDKAALERLKVEGEERRVQAKLNKMNAYAGVPTTPAAAPVTQGGYNDFNAIY